MKYSHKAGADIIKLIPAFSITASIEGTWGNSLTFSLTPSSLCNTKLTTDSTNSDRLDVKTVTGHQCKKGVKHAEKEVTFPGRVLTTTMKTDIHGIPLVPVRSNKEVPKNQLITCMKEISKHHVSSPVKIGEIVMKDILGLGVDITACRTIH